ncbi:hypothetical protein EVAR_62477_1 [Eumeta japonica]|uniref:Uncharacterized protein n=1 Tax=Eumeta variegata TaxID=151549 RepID=A0A4C1ZJE0_EUMVA|nr:hypothetical protein EVAR_62477_1 [Eumeta japonica]
MRIFSKESGIFTSLKRSVWGWRHLSAGGGRGVNRAESCRERGGSAAHVRRGKQRNASDPNRLTADQAHKLV